MKKIIFPVVITFIMVILPVTMKGASNQMESAKKGTDDDRLAILWTSGDPDVAKKMRSPQTEGFPR